MSLEQAVASAEVLRDLLEREVEGARRESRLLRRLDASGLLDRAARRSGFLVEAQQAGNTVANELRRAAASLNLRGITLEFLRTRAPAPGPALADLLAEVRTLSGTLSELDRLNRALATRALACVRGHVAALSPAPSAYDRRGGRSFAAPNLSSVSSKA
jgi:hypothetical protein